MYTGGKNMKTKAAVTHANGDPFTIEPVELDEPKAGELLVKIVACGVCHTDESAQQGAQTQDP